MTPRPRRASPPPANKAASSAWSTTASRRSTWRKRSAPRNASSPNPPSSNTRWPARAPASTAATSHQAPKSSYASAATITPPDAKEIITFGPDTFPDTAYFTCEAAAPHWIANLWPTNLPGFRDDILAYWHEMQQLARRLTRLCAIALNLAPDFFEQHTDRDPSQLRLIHYPPMDAPPQPGQLRAGVHTDLNLITIVYSNNTVGGLEVRGRDGEWIAAPHFEGFMVNIGDTMMRWCNDHWKSTPHRVANPPPNAGATSDRIALAFFFIANYDALIECVPACTGPDNPPRYAPITVGEYRAARFAKTAIG